MRNLVYLLFFMVFNMQAQIKMSPSEADALKQTVKKQADKTQTITSDFTQYKHLDFLTNDIITKGKLNFKAPDLVKWEYLEPYKYAAIFKNGTLYITDEGKKSDISMNSNKLFKQLNSLIIKSVKGEMFDDKEFNIEYYKKDENSLVYFIPKSKKSAKYIKAFHITFNSVGNVEEVKIVEPSGDFTRIVFSNKILNKPIADTVFTQ